MWKARYKTPKILINLFLPLIDTITLQVHTEGAANVMGHVCLRGECQINFDLVFFFNTLQMSAPSLPSFTLHLCLGASHSPGTSGVRKSWVLWRENRSGFLQKALPTGTKNWLHKNGQRAPGGRIPVQEQKNQMLGDLGKQELAGRSGRRSFQSWSFLS